MHNQATKLFETERTCNLLEAKLRITLYSLQVMFAVIGSEFTALPWLVYEAIKMQGIDLFASAAEVRHTAANQWQY